MSSIRLPSERCVVHFRTDLTYQLLLFRDLLRRIGGSENIDENLILDLPELVEGERDLHFFKVDHRVLFYSGVIAEYEKRALVPAHPILLAQLLADEPDFCFYLDVTTHWVNSGGEWCSFTRHRKERGGCHLKMHTNSAHGYFEGGWSYIGVPGQQQR